MDTSPERYWLYSWMDEFDVRSAERVPALLKLPGPVERLHELAAQDDPLRPIPVRRQGVAPPIVAGRRIDLSGTLSCAHHECLERQVDRLFNMVWHYFDQIVVEGLPASEVVWAVQSASNQTFLRFQSDLQEAIYTLLYLRKIGAEHYLVFRQKPDRLCREHTHSHAATHGITTFTNEQLRRNAVNRLLAQSDITTRLVPGGWHYTLRHTDLDEPISGLIGRQRRRSQPSKRAVAQEVLERHCRAMIGDVEISRSLQLPLANSVETSWLPFPSANNEGSSSDDVAVALKLRFPVLQGVSALEVIRMREEESAHFECFRSSLRRAIREQLSRLGNGSPQVIADAVIAEHVTPALADIEARLAAKQRAAGKKTAMQMSVGGAMTTVGLLSGMPPLVAAGVTVLATSPVHAMKYMDDKSDIELADMYFLWQMRQEK